MFWIFDFSSQVNVGKSEIARNTETVANTAPVKILKEKLPQRHRGWKRFACGCAPCLVRNCERQPQPTPLPLGKLTASLQPVPGFVDELIRRLIVTFPRQMMMMTPVFLIVGVIRKSCPAPDWEE